MDLPELIDAPAPPLGREGFGISISCTGRGLQPGDAKSFEDQGAAASDRERRRPGSWLLIVAAVETLPKDVQPEGHTSLADADRDDEGFDQRALATVSFGEA